MGRARIAPTLVMLALVCATLGALSAAGYTAGRGIDSDLRFLEPRRSPTVDEALLAYPVEYALRSDEKNDAIFVGDSTCRCGIDPLQFERVSGLRAFNLGSLGNAGPTGFLITAEAYLWKHPRPQVVVLCMAPTGFELNGADMAAKIGSNLPLRFEANYGPEVPGLVPFEESVEYFIKRGSLSLWEEAFFWDKQTTRDVRDLPMVGRLDQTFRTIQRKSQEVRGFHPLVGLHGKRFQLDTPSVPVRIDPTWDRSVRLLEERCESLGVPLLIRFSPMPSDLAQEKDFTPVERWAHDLQAAYPRLHVGQPVLLWYDWALCYDNLHLNAAGIEVYMKRLAQDIRPLISAVPQSRH
ncbi:MAG TPA: hypothetical protein VEI07_12215 [Planctomycetaceae bacterium]|nr:hypothetical protein [Planctomycetaceae bacterium]